MNDQDSVNYFGVILVQSVTWSRYVYYTFAKPDVFLHFTFQIPLPTHTLSFFFLCPRLLCLISSTSPPSIFPASRKFLSSDSDMPRYPFTEFVIFQHIEFYHKLSTLLTHPYTQTPSEIHFSCYPFKLSTCSCTYLSLRFFCSVSDWIFKVPRNCNIAT